MMEEIAGFEDRLNNLKIKGDTLISRCADHLQSKLKQSVQSHLQGTGDSYSAICSTAQRVSTPDCSLTMMSYGEKSCGQDGFTDKTDA
jgi:hypothetical protein